MVTPPADAQEMASERPTRMPGGIGGADDGSDRGAGDGDRRDAEVVQNFQENHVGDAPRSPGSERHTETFRPNHRGLAVDP